MKRLLASALMSLLCTTSHAEWSLITESVNDNGFYLDFTTHVRSENMVKIWSLADFKIPKMLGERPVQSTKDLRQFNCKELEVRSTYLVRYTKSMGTGIIVASVNTSDDPPIPTIPDTVDMALLKAACSYKP